MHVGKVHNGGSFGFRGLERSFSNIQSTFNVSDIARGRGSIQGEILAAVEVFRPKARVRTPLPPTRTTPSIQPVGILNDIVKNVVGGITGGSARDINAQPSTNVFTNVLNDLILGATTSRQSRAATGTPRAGDLFKSLERDVFGGGRIGPGALPLRIPGTAAPVGGTAEIFDLALRNLGRGSTLQLQPQGGAPVALSLVNGGMACPPGAQSFPAGTCLTDFQWEDAGSPRGFEIIGRQDGHAILRKRGRRRRRHGLTKSQMGQVSWACNLPPNCRKEVLHGIVHG